MPAGPSYFRATVISNDAGGGDVSERVVEAGALAEIVHPLGLTFPSDVYSLSNVALPFSENDRLYGVVSQLVV